MCRLCLATFTDVRIPKAQLVHELMLRTSHDELGQKDGWGVTDTENTWRGSDWYFEDTPIWLRRVNQRKFIISHLRKASGGTGRTRIENHPYHFDVNGETLIAVHNGYFSGTKYVYNQGTPNTDSYRALSILATMMAERHTDDIDADLINEWLGQFQDDSHYAVMLHWRDHVYALRGKTRTLAALEVGNGYLVHTNIKALAFAKAYLAAVHGIENDRVPYPIADNKLLRFPLGAGEVVVSDIDPKHVQAQTSTVVWSNTAPKTQTPSTSVSVRNASDDLGESNQRFVIAPPVTTPRPTKPVVLGVNEPNTEELTMKRRRLLWQYLAGKLSPLRSELSAYWAASILGYEDAYERPSPALFLCRVTLKEFDILSQMLCPTSAEDETKYIKPFTPVSTYMINWWNHHVKAGYDASAHDALFSVGMFFLDPKFTRMLDPEGNINNPNYVMTKWVPYMLGLIGQLPPAVVRSHFDMDKLGESVLLYATKKEEPISISTEMILSGGLH